MQKLVYHKVFELVEFVGHLFELKVLQFSYMHAPIGMVHVKTHMINGRISDRVTFDTFGSK